ncbi:MAG: Zn-ribbon containing protein [archaeon]
MPHQCVKCSRIIPLGSKELLEGCTGCGGHFFFYIKEEQLDRIRENPIVIPENDKEKIEKDVREMAGIVDEETPVILDLESIRVAGSGKFEIDIVNLFNKNRPLIYKLEEGKYIIDLASTLKQNVKDVKEIKDPDLKN